MAFSSRFHTRTMSLAIATAAAGLPFSAIASMGNLGTTYRVMPVDVATARSLSMFNDPVSATYYNPAYLTEDERGELTAGISCTQSRNFVLPTRMPTVTCCPVLRASMC